jgi:hypothetical protein
MNFDKFREKFCCVSEKGIDVVAVKFGDGEICWRPEAIEAFISSHYRPIETSLDKEEVKKAIEGMKKEAHVCMCNDDDCLIECNESYNNALADLLTLLKLEE